MVIAVDFGTAGSGASYAFVATPETITPVNTKSGQNKMPTALLLGTRQEFVAFGADAINQYAALTPEDQQAYYLFTAFKMGLYTPEPAKPAAPTAPTANKAEASPLPNDNKAPLAAAGAPNQAAPPTPKGSTTPTAVADKTPADNKSPVDGKGPVEVLKTVVAGEGKASVSAPGDAKVGLVVAEPKVGGPLMVRARNGRYVEMSLVLTESLRYLRNLPLKAVRGASTHDLLRDSDVRYVVTVPAIWVDSSKQMMRNAAIAAGYPADEGRLLLALESEAAALACRHADVKNNGRLTEAGMRLVVIDAGGGTLDITSHRVCADGTVSEVQQTTGNDCGSWRVDKAFVQWLRVVFGAEEIDKYANDNPNDFFLIGQDFEQQKILFEPAPARTAVGPPLVGAGPDSRIRLPPSFVDTFKLAGAGNARRQIWPHPKPPLAAAAAAAAPVPQPAAILPIAPAAILTPAPAVSAAGPKSVAVLGAADVKGATAGKTVVAPLVAAGKTGVVGAAAPSKSAVKETDRLLGFGGILDSSDEDGGFTLLDGDGNDGVEVADVSVDYFAALGRAVDSTLTPIFAKGGQALEQTPLKAVSAPDSAPLVGVKSAQAASEQTGVEMTDRRPPVAPLQSVSESAAPSDQSKVGFAADAKVVTPDGKVISEGAKGDGTLKSATEGAKVYGKVMVLDAMTLAGVGVGGKVGVARSPEEDRKHLAASLSYPVSEETAAYQRGGLRLSHGQMLSFYVPLLYEMAVKSDEVMAATRADFMFSVGGFSESPLVFKVLSDIAARYNARIVRPPNCGMAVLTGATLYGLNRQLVSARVVKRTYGLEVCWPGISGFKGRPSQRMPHVNNPDYTAVPNVLEHFVTAGQVVPCDEEVTKNFWTMDPWATRCHLFLYACDSADVHFTDQVGAQKLAEIVILLSENGAGGASPTEGRFTVTFQFGSTEIAVSAHDRYSNRTCETKLTFGGQGLDGPLSKLLPSRTTPA
jgi:hypothetical protein